MSAFNTVEARTTKCRIVIVDDHPAVRHGLTLLVSRDPDVEVCGEAASAREALQQVETERPELMIVDISLGGESGLQLIKRIKSLYPSVKMLVSSMHDETIFAPRALRAGAHGYINKREPVEKVMDAVRQVLDGEIYLSPRMRSRLLHRSAIGEPLDSDPTASLTNRELEVFELIGQGLDTREISHRLSLSPKTIVTHRTSIMTKLNLENSRQLTRYALIWAKEGH